MQVGNAVAVPVAKALGYALGQAFRGLADGKDPLFTLPEAFPNLSWFTFPFRFVTNCFSDKLLQRFFLFRYGYE